MTDENIEIVSPLRILILARALISDPSHWAKGRMYADKTGITCGYEDAVCYCAMGALFQARRVLKAKGISEYIIARNALSDRIPSPMSYLDSAERIQRFNDYIGTSHASMQAVFDAAINDLTEEAPNAG